LNEMLAPFHFLMPVWGVAFVDYLLKLGLATLMAPDNIPGLPNLKDSKFIFLTTEQDAERIKKSNLYAQLAELVSVEWEFFDFFGAGQPDKYKQLEQALLVGVNKVVGKGYCLFVHPDSVYSNGTMRRLYQLAERGKKAVISIGPPVADEKTFKYMDDRGLSRFDEAVDIPPRQMVKILENNFHTDMIDHFWENDNFPEDPFVTIWKAPGGRGYLFRYISLHPILVDLRDIKRIVEFGNVDHGFVHTHGFLWRDIHIETDSDNYIVIALKPEEDRGTDLNAGVNPDKAAAIGRMVTRSSNWSFNRFNFLNGVWAHTTGISKEWVDFEIQNLKEMNVIIERETAYKQRSVAKKISDAFKSILIRFCNIFSIYSLVRIFNNLVSLVVPKQARRLLKTTGRALVNALPENMTKAINKFLSRVHTSTIANSD